VCTLSGAEAGRSCDGSLTGRAKMAPQGFISRQTRSISPPAGSHSWEVCVSHGRPVHQHAPPLNDDRAIKLTSKWECVREQVKSEYLPRVPLVVPPFQLPEASLCDLDPTQVPFNEVFSCSIETRLGRGTTLSMNANFNSRVCRCRTGLASSCPRCRQRQAGGVSISGEHCSPEARLHDTSAGIRKTAF
jgi:hypothetical protein